MRNVAFGLIILSLAFCVLIVVAVVGIGNTPYDAVDRTGARMGFNDHLSLEHYAILFSNFRFQSLLTSAYLYGWLLMAMHVLGGWVLLQTPRLDAPRVRWFFGLQCVLFPAGWFGFFTLPSTIWSIANGTFDREGFIDVPFIALTAHPMWIATAVTILAMSWSGSIRMSSSPDSCEPRPA
jgi:hypothetical protein